MATLDDLKRIIETCKCSVTLEVNSYRDDYTTVKDYIDRINSTSQDEIDEELAKELIEANCVYKLQIYPTTPVGFFVLYDSSLDSIINRAKAVLDLD